MILLIGTGHAYFITCIGDLKNIKMDHRLFSILARQHWCFISGQQVHFVSDVLGHVSVFVTWAVIQMLYLSSALIFT